MTEIQDALRYLNSEEVQAALSDRVNFREENGKYFASHDESKEQRMTADEVIQEANHYRLVLWRRANYKQLSKDPLLLQCKVCGAVFSHYSQHTAPCAAH